MPKVRVYELAKELGVESKTVLSMLKDMGEFVRSASSTVEAPVERRLKEKLASEPPPAKKSAKKPAAKTPATAADTNGEATTSVAATAVEPVVDQTDGSTAIQAAAPSSAPLQSPLDARPGQVPPARKDGQPDPGEPRADQLPAAGRTTPPAAPGPIPRGRRLARVMSVGPQLDPAHGLVRPADCPVLRDRPVVAPGFHAPATTRSRLLRAWVSRAHLGPALQTRPGLVDLAHHWAARRRREAGQVCPACRGQIPP